MRLLITGASGLLGLNLALEAGKMHTVIGVDRNRLVHVPFEQVTLDLLAAGQVEAALETARPDGVVHCAALANLEACEADPGLAQRLNADLPGELALACKKRGIKMLHISTDAVFDGSAAGEYTESDAPTPPGVYSSTKWQGEQNVLAANPHASVARVNFYGWSISGRRSLSEYFFNALSAGKLCNGFTDVSFCPTFVGDLADLLLEMLAKNLNGLYHAVGARSMSKYDFGVAVARRFGFDEKLIAPISVEQAGLAARRSHNLRLSIHKLSTDLGHPLPEFSTGLDKFHGQYQQGYPQLIHSFAEAGQA
jgi:dTDP-4-dehydrorhamnose reductase